MDLSLLLPQQTFPSRICTLFNKEIDYFPTIKEVKEAMPRYRATLYVGDLIKSCTEAKLFEVFNAIGPVSSLRIIRHYFTRRPLGFAYINFSFNSFNSWSDTKCALDTMDHMPIMGKACRVRWHKRIFAIDTKRMTCNSTKPETYVFLSNLNEKIRFHCTATTFNSVINSKMYVDENTGKTLGFGFLKFNSASAAKNAINVLNGTIIEGKKLQASPCVNPNLEHCKKELLRKAAIHAPEFVLKIPFTSQSDLFFLSKKLIRPYFTNLRTGEIKKPWHLITYWKSVFSYLTFSEIDIIEMRQLCRLFRDSFPKLKVKYVIVPSKKYPTMKVYQNKLYNYLNAESILQSDHYSYQYFCNTTSLSTTGTDNDTCNSPSSVFKIKEMYDKLQPQIDQNGHYIGEQVKLKSVLSINHRIVTSWSSATITGISNMSTLLDVMQEQSPSRIHIGQPMMFYPEKEGKIQCKIHSKVPNTNMWRIEINGNLYKRSVSSNELIDARPIYEICWNNGEEETENIKRNHFAEHYNVSIQWRETTNHNSYSYYSASDFLKATDKRRRGKQYHNNRKKVISKSTWYGCNVCHKMLDSWEKCKSHKVDCRSKTYVNFEKKKCRNIAKQFIKNKINYRKKYGLPCQLNIPMIVEGRKENLQ